MNSSTTESRIPTATSVHLSDDLLVVDLSDGRTLSVPVGWYPRLTHATPEERSHWRLIGRGRGIHWPEIDEVISIENLIAGQPSHESQSSFQRWLDQRPTEHDP